MATFVEKAVALLSNPRLLSEYVKYRVPKVFGREPTINTPFSGKVTANTFSQFHSVYCLMPSQSESNLVQRLNPDDGVFFDVGANVGVWSVMLAMCHPESHVFSFEPAPGTCALLSKNLRLNCLRNACCEQLAVSDVDANVQFQEPRNASVFSRLLRPGADDHDGRFADSEINMVRSMSLDTYCRDHSIHRIHFLKVDVEGAEPLVLRGLERMLRERCVDAIYIEIEPDNLRSMGFAVEDLTRAMEPGKYSCFRLLADGSPGENVDLREVRGGNVLCLPL